MGTHFTIARNHAMSYAVLQPFCCTKLACSASTESLRYAAARSQWGLETRDTGNHAIGDKALVTSLVASCDAEAPPPDQSVQLPSLLPK